VPPLDSPAAKPAVPLPAMPPCAAARQGRGMRLQRRFIEKSPPVYCDFEGGLAGIKMSLYYPLHTKNAFVPNVISGITLKAFSLLDWNVMGLENTSLLIHCALFSHSTTAQFLVACRQS
jgi:hypothetical protein